MNVFEMLPAGTILLQQAIDLSQHGGRTRADAKVVCQIQPTYFAVAVDQELGGAGDVAPIFAGAGMQYPIAPDYFSFWIAQEVECIALISA